MDKGFKMSARRGRSGAWKGVGGVFGVFESVGSAMGWRRWGESHLFYVSVSGDDQIVVKSY